MNAWDNLPNAKHIDAVIEAAKDLALRDAWYDARDAWEAAWDAAWGAAWGAARDAIRALVAWDESAELLTMDPDAVFMIANIGDAPRKHQAVLLYPYVMYLSVRGLTK